MINLYLQQPHVCAKCAKTGEQHTRGTWWVYCAHSGTLLIFANKDDTARMCHAVRPLSEAQARDHVAALEHDAQAEGYTHDGGAAH